jgi:glutathione synthase
MRKLRIAFVIDKIELKWFELNELVTSFWLIKEFLQRNHEVCITTIDKLYLKADKPFANMFATSLKMSGQKLVDMIYDRQEFSICLNEFDMILFRPDPPVTMEYIFATYILDFVDKSSTKVLNSPDGIRKANEKIYINNFAKYIPKGITTSNALIIKEFVTEHEEAVLKPLNRCFGKGVYYLKKGDTNLNTIIDSATNSNETPVMVQEYLKNANNQDKRIIIIGGQVYGECITKLSGKEDFKFNTHRDEFFNKTFLTDKEREMCQAISSKLIEDGLYLVGLDVMDEKLIEINITSPCFFIKEINSMFNTQIEKRIVDYLEYIAVSDYCYSFATTTLI